MLPLPTVYTCADQIIWMMHNLQSHEAFHPSLERWFWRQFIPRIDGAISLSSAGLSLAIKRFPRLKDIPTAVIPHGHYREDYPQSTVVLRKALGIPEESKYLCFWARCVLQNISRSFRPFRQVTIPNALLYSRGARLV